MASSLTVNSLLLNEPDWTKNLRYSVKFNTSIQTTITGAERRAALRTQPDRSLNFQITEYGNDSIELRSKLYKNIGDSNWGVPLWTDYSKLNSQANVTDTSVNVTTINKHFYVGGYCIIFHSKDAYEYKKIFSLTASTISFSSGLAATWTINTAVFPMMVARIGKSIDINFHSNKVISTDIKANELYYSDNNYEAVEPTYFDLHDELSGKPLYVFSPDHNWAAKRKIKISNQYNDLKFLADSYLYNHWTETDAINYIYLTLTNLKDIYHVENFFNHVKGRCHSFFLPSGVTDIILSANALSTDSTLAIENTGFADYYTDSGTPNTTAEHIEIINADNTKIYCKINSATNTQLNLSDNIGTAITDYANCKVSIMAEARFMNDELEIDYISQNVAKIQLACKWQQGDLVDRYSMNYTTSVEAGWLEYATITIDNSKIDEILTNFPFMLNIGITSGTGHTDLTGLFTSIGDNYKKIQIRANDGLTPLYAEVIRWDFINNTAQLYIKIPVISNSLDTIIRLYYYTSNIPVNNYTDIAGTTIGKNVWDSNFLMVQHMEQNPSITAPQMLDSTDNNYNGTSINMDGNNLVDGLSSKAIFFNGNDNYIDFGNILDSPTVFTFSALIKAADVSTGNALIIHKGNVANNIVNYGFGLNLCELRFLYNPAGDSYKSFTTTTLNLQIDTFYYIACTITRTPSVIIEMFLDGVSVFSGSNSKIMQHNNWPCRIAPDYWGNRYNGIIDNITFSDVARSSSHIKAENYSLRDNLASITLV